MATVAANKLANGETAISNLIPFSYHLTDTVLSTKQRDFFSVIKVSGRSHQTLSIDDLDRWTNELNMTMVSQCSLGVELYSYTIRKKANEYPKRKFPSVFAQQFNDKYEQSFVDKDMFVNELYLCIMYRPFTNSVSSFFAGKQKLSQEKIFKWQEEAISTLNNIVNAFMKSLTYYRAELLGVEEKNGKFYSAALRPFKFIMNGYDGDVPITRERLCEHIAEGQIDFGLNSGIGYFHNYKKTDYFGMAEIREYDMETNSGNLNILLEEPFELVVVNSFSAITRAAAEDQLKIQKQHMRDTQDAGVTQTRQLDIAMDQLKSGLFGMGVHHCTMLVRGDNAEEVKDRLAVCVEDLSRLGLLCKPLDRALEAGFYAQFIGNRNDRPRPCPITTLNYICFTGFHNFFTGKAHGNPWGDAIMMFRTPSSSPFYFNYHHTRLDENSEGLKVAGHLLALGKTGAGKSTLISALLTMTTDINPSMCIFDKDRGMEPLVKALGGEYFNISIGEKTGFNPLQMEPTAQNIAFITDLLTLMLEQDGLGLTPVEREQLSSGIRFIMGNVDAVHRKLSVLLQYFGDVQSDDINARPTLRIRFQRWVGDGQHAWLFDNDVDRLSLSNGIVGFDITEFLEYPEIRRPLMKYLIYRTDEMITGVPFIYVFEEFWRMDGDPDFMKLAKNGLKTLRKRNGICAFLTQEADDALNSEIGKSLSSQIATLIVLRNDMASYEDYKQFNLTPDEFDLIKNKFSEQDRKFLIRQGGGSETGGNSVVVSFELPREMQDQINILSGTPELADLLDDIIKKRGNDPADWLDLYYQEAKELLRKKKSNTESKRAI